MITVHPDSSTRRVNTESSRRNVPIRNTVSSLTSHALYQRHIEAEFLADTQAMEYCRSHFAIALTAADTVRVTQTIAYDTTRFAAFTCGELRALERRP